MATRRAGGCDRHRAQCVTRAGRGVRIGISPQGARQTHCCQCRTVPMRHEHATALAVVLLVCLAGCDSTEKKAYRALANQANTILEAMRPAAARLLATDPSDHTATIEACMSADEQLWQLRGVDFRAEHMKSGSSRDLPVTMYVEQLLDYRKSNCKSSLTANCSETCRWAWLSIIEGVERVRTRARRSYRIAQARRVVSFSELYGARCRGGLGPREWIKPSQLARQHQPRRTSSSDHHRVLRHAADSAA